MIGMIGIIGPSGEDRVMRTHGAETLSRLTSIFKKELDASGGHGWKNQGKPTCPYQPRVIQSDDMATDVGIISAFAIDIHDRDGKIRT